MANALQRRKGWSRIGQLAKGAAISQANRARAELNRSPSKTWTAREMRIVMKLYPDYQAMQASLPNRTYNQIRTFCQNYGIATSDRHVWTVVEIKLLKALWESGMPTHKVKTKFAHNPTQAEVAGVARYYGLVRPKKPPVLLGHPVVDAIRRECFNRNYSMADLDEWCGSGVFWSKAHGHRSFRCWKHLEKALEVLGGSLEVRWRSQDEP